jgi:hypothetical protein
MNERVTKTAKHTLTLLTSVYEALKLSAERDGVEPNELIQSLIIDRVIADGTLDAETQEHILTGRRLIATAVDVAKQRCRDGLFADTITLDTFKACCADAKWLKDYEAYVGDNPYKNGNPLKAINREIGFGIRRAIGGIVQKDDGGKAVTVKVLGEVIQSYTPMASFDKTAVQ